MALVKTINTIKYGIYYHEINTLISTKRVWPVVYWIYLTLQAAALLLISTNVSQKTKTTLLF